MKKNRMSIEQIRAWYDAHRGDAAFEPNWTHPLFQAAFEGDKEMLEAVKETLSLPDGSVVEAFPGLPGGPKRLMEDGFKVGTTSWIFFGRKNPAYRKIVGSWVILGRRWAGNGAINYMAFHKDRPMGLSAMTGQELGPSFDLAEIELAVQQDQPANMSPVVNFGFDVRRPFFEPL